jgi:hypothetical protein
MCGSRLAGHDLFGIIKWSAREDWRAARQLIPHVAVLQSFAVTGRKEADRFFSAV